MIRFVIKVGFFLGLVALIVPGGESREGEPEINPFALLYGAQAAVSDLSNFCGRAPAACAAGADVAGFAGERVAEGFAIAYGFFDNAVAERRGNSHASDAATATRSVSASRDSASAGPAARPVPTSPVRTDAVTTAAISAAASPSPAIPSSARPHVVIPGDRALQPTGHGILGGRVATQNSGRLPRVESRPLPKAGPGRQIAATVPVPVPAPRT